MKKLVALGIFSLSAVASVSTDYYLGEIRVTSPNGRARPASLALAKRVTNDASSVIVEEVLHVTPSTTEKYVTVMKVSGNEIAVKDSANRFSGKGKLIGKPWAWTKWEIQASLADGSGTFKAKHHRTKDGILVLRDFLDPAGKVRLRYSEDLRQVSRDIYEILHSRLARPSATKEPVG